MIAQKLEQDKLDHVVEYLRGAMKIDIESNRNRDWEVSENAPLEAMLTDFDAMRKRGAWNKCSKLTE